MPEKKSDFFVKGTEQNHVIIAMPGFTVFEEERYAARVLTTILGGNMSSRLFQEIREKLGLCYYIGAGHHASFEYWIFTIRSGLSKENFAFLNARDLSFAWYYCSGGDYSRGVWKC